MAERPTATLPRRAAGPELDANRILVERTGAVATTSDARSGRTTTTGVYCMTRLLALGYAPDALPHRLFDAPPDIATEAPAVFRPETDGDERTVLARLHDVVDRLGRPGGNVRGQDPPQILAVYPAWRPEPARRWLQAVRAAREDLQIVLHGSGLPPLAGAVLTAAVAARGQGHGAAALAAATITLERAILAMGWLDRLTGLEHPAPTLAQHARSLAPWVRYVAVASPHARIEPARGREPRLPIDTRRGSLVLAAGDERERSTVTRALRASSVSATWLAPQPLASVYWGTGRGVEIVGVPDDLPARVTRAARANRGGDCRWCGQRDDGAVCRYCGARQTPRVLRQDVA